MTEDGILASPAAEPDLKGPTGDSHWRTISDLALEAGERLGDAPAIVDLDRTLTYGELADRMLEFASGLIAAGVERGDRVAIWAPNTWRWIVAALGTHAAGAALVPINTRYTGREAAYILDRAKPKVVATVHRFLGKDYPAMLREAGFRPEPGQRLIRLEGDETAAMLRDAGLDPQGGEGDLADRLGGASGQDISDVMFTSGTTGFPKGVMTCHAQNLRAYWDWSRAAGFKEGDRYAIVNPFFHAFGYKAGWLSALMHGATIYPHAVFDAERLLAQVKAQRITVLPGPPTLYHSLFQIADSPAGLESLRLAITGAASIAPALVRRMKEQLGFERITTCYGMTEGTGVATITRAGDSLETVARTSGRALPGIELRVVGPDGAPVRAGEPGEIRLRGYNVMRGYLDDPEGTRGAVDEEGWLHTGDIGVLDHEGLRVTDRLRDMFVTGGFNVYPAEVEACLVEHHDIAEVAVIGVPDERQGEVGMAFIVLRAGANPGADELLDWSRARLANFKVPRHYAFVEELPRNATGKVLKDKLRAIASADRENRQKGDE